MDTRTWLAPLLALLLVGPLEAQVELLVTSRFTDQVLSYDGASGAFLGVFCQGGGLDNPVGLTFGPDGNLYVASGDTDEVLRYDGTTGAFIDVFAAGGGLDGPRQVNFGPDGHLYVASGATDEVLRYDGTSGAFLGVFASGGNLNGPTSFAFGPSGALYVGSVLNDRIKSYDGQSGAFLGNFASQGLNGPHDLAFGPDGNLYVSNAFSARIRRYDGVTGALRDTFIDDPALSGALGLCWDERGRLYVVNQGRNEVRRYNAFGRFLGSLVATGSGGLSAPLFAVFRPAVHELRVAGPLPGVPGVTNWVALDGARPGGRLELRIGNRPVLRRRPGCSLAAHELLPFFRVPLVADESGRALFASAGALDVLGSSVFLQGLEEDSCATSPVLPFRF